MKPVFTHPDGFGAISYDPKTQRLFLGNESEALSAWAYIGPWGLRELAEKLLKLAAEMGVKQ